jgi:Predicted membrane protein (DUF2254)
VVQFPGTGIQALAKLGPDRIQRVLGRGWLAGALPGLALVSVAVMLVVLFGVLDATRRHSLMDLLVPDPAAAGGTLALVGGAEGVTISIVLLVVVFGIQMTSSRYSPRIIGLFTRNLWNALVLGISLVSILYTFIVRSEIKPDYVPFWGFVTAEVLALVNFGILLPYVGYIFEVMRAETLVGRVRRQALRQLRMAVGGKRLRRHRQAVLTSIAQIVDIALGSIQLGDLPVCVLSVGVLGQFIADDYLKVKGRFPADWFEVGHGELPGASDQIVSEAVRGRTWLEYIVLSSFVDLVGLTPIHRKEAVHAIALATRDIGLAAIEHGDPETAELCVRFFNTYLRSALNRMAPTFASSTMNEYRRLAIGALEWRPDLAVEAAAHLLRYGRHFDQAGMPAIFGAAAEDVADLAIEADGHDPIVTVRLARLLVDNLAELLPDAQPIGLNGLFKAVAKLAFWAMAEGKEEVAEILLQGIAAAPPDFVDSALARMETLDNGLFWEVNERVVAFDWVDPDLRAQIPAVREALRGMDRRESHRQHPAAASSGPEDLVHPA